MITAIVRFVARRRWIYLFPALMDFSLGCFLFFAAVKAVEHGAAPVVAGALGSMWGLTYFVFSLVIGRFAHRGNARLLMNMSCAGFIALSVLFGLSKSLPSLFLLLILCGLATAFFFIGFQLFMGEGAGLPLDRSTSWYTFSWSVGMGSGSLVEGLLVARGPVAALAPVTLSAAAIIAGLAVVDRLAKSAPPAPVSAPHSPASAAPGTARTYVAIGWIGIFTVTLVTSGVRFLLPKVTMESLGFAPWAAGLAVFGIFFLQGVAGAFLCRVSWRYRFAAHGWMKLVGVAGLLAPLVLPGPAGIAVLSVLLGVYAGHAYYNGVFYSLNDEHRSGPNVGINEALVGVASVAGPSLLGAALACGTAAFLAAPAGVLAATWAAQAAVLRLRSRPAAARVGPPGD